MTSAAHAATGASASNFIRAVLREVCWRGILMTQVLALLFAITPWFSLWGTRQQPDLRRALLEQALIALLVLLAALSGDEAVRRGGRVWRAFLIVALCASLINIAGQWVLDALFSAPRSGTGLTAGVNDFFNVGAVWGTALLVYLHRQSAQRLLAGLRADELARVQAERRLIASRLAGTQGQVELASVLRELTSIRDLYGSGQSAADEGLERLIADLRVRVVRGAAAAEAPLSIEYAPPHGPIT